MMNKKTIFITLGIILVLGVLVVGQVVPSINNKDIFLNQNQKDALTRLNMDNYDYSDTNLDEDNVERCLVKTSNGTSVLNTCKTFKRFESVCSDENCTSYNKDYFTNSEMNDVMDAWEVERISKIADVTLDREEKVGKTKELVRSGNNKVKSR